VRKNLKRWGLIAAVILGACAIVTVFMAGGFGLFSKPAGGGMANDTITPANPVRNNSRGAVLMLLGTKDLTDTSIGHGPIEDDPKLGPIVEKARREALSEELANQPERLGFCHIVWATQKRILKDKYGIDWKTPAEMNPGILFD
jgi:hypothetical protein